MHRTRETQNLQTFSRRAICVNANVRAKASGPPLVLSPEAVRVSRGESTAGDLPQDSHVRVGVKWNKQKENQHLRMKKQSHRRKRQRWGCQESFRPTPCTVNKNTRYLSITYCLCCITPRPRCLSGESPVVLFRCERQTLEKILTQFSRYSPKVMSENGLSDFLWVRKSKPLNYWSGNDN